MNLRFLLHVVLVFSFSFFLIPLNAQDLATRNIVELKKLLKEREGYDHVQKERIKKYLADNQNKIKHQEFQDQKYLLVGITDNGLPLYYAHANEDSFRDLGGASVTSGGDFGLDLGGKDINVVIWDSGVNRRSHQEFSGRVLRQDVGAEDDHATHVAGTMLAEGIVSRARGFLPLATAKTYDFGDDVTEIINELVNTDIHVSNHSYGLVLGWDRGRWFGDASISDQESYLFGFYSAESKAFDEILYNAPYYCVVRASGNDRGDSGDGTFPPDGPYDIIDGFGLSKNTFTIGAVEKLQGDYTSREDIIMSSFSSWGPTDDGRIKPDFVAPGVNIYSALSESDNDYGSNSGTSMATPAAAGAIGLINEAYFTFNQEYLKSATMKALLAQTALDAGDGPGPDYEFGWGMISIENAVDLILREDDNSVFVSEETLQNGETWEMELNPLENSDLTVTIAWTDPAGTPVAPALDPTNLMLVNDLDMRIVDTDGNEVTPYILDPSRPSVAASTGDNFRDNIEKIEFNITEPKTYFLRVTHKGQLENDAQDFSLVLDYESQSEGVSNLYWVNESGAVDEEIHWANTSGGNGAFVPDANSKLIIDNNSFSESQNVINLTQDASVFGLVALTDDAFTLNLGGNVLEIASSTFMASSNYTITNGTLRFVNTTASNEFSIDLNETQLQDVTIEIGGNNLATWKIEDDAFDAASIVNSSGALRVSDSQINTLQLVCSGGDCNISNSTFSNMEILDLRSADYTDDAATSYNFNSSKDVALELGSQNLDGIVTIVGSNGNINSNSGGLNGLSLSASNITTGSDLTVTTLSLKDQGNIILNSGSVLTLTGDVLELENGSGVMSSGQSEINLSGHNSFCFDEVNISNVNLTGFSSISVGLNSQINNASGWQAVACSNLLFVDFTVVDGCQNGRTSLISNSSGGIAQTNWFVDDVLISTEENTSFVFPDTLAHSIRIEVQDMQNNMQVWEQEFMSLASSLDSNYIIQNSTSLVSFRLADRYEWYQNNVLIPNSNNRILPYNGEKALFYVLTFSGSCNRQSTAVDFSSAVINIDKGNSDLISIGPNPTSNQLVIELSASLSEISIIEIIDIQGRVRMSKDLKSRNAALNLSDLESGVYIVSVMVDDDVYVKRITVQH